MRRSRPTPAQGHLREARTRFAQTGDRYGLARVDDAEGLLAAGAGDHARARACFEASLAALRDLGHPWAAIVLRYLGDTAIAQGDLVRARAAFEESVALERGRGAPALVSIAPLSTARLGGVARAWRATSPAPAPSSRRAWPRYPDVPNVAAVALGGGRRRGPRRG